jgi:hypothetical protein
LTSRRSVRTSLTAGVWEAQSLTQPKRAGADGRSSRQENGIFHISFDISHLPLKKTISSLGKRLEARRLRVKKMKNGGFKLKCNFEIGG